MQSRKLSSLMLAALLSFAGALTLYEVSKDVTIESSGRIFSASPLHVEGRYIKDILNNTIILRGVNHGAYRYDILPGGNWPAVGDVSAFQRCDYWNDSRPQEHYRVLRDEWGANAMRWTFDMCSWWENPDDFRYYFRRGIELAQEYGIYIILAPWRVHSIDFIKDPLPYPPYNHTHIHFQSEQAFIDCWVEIATYLSDLPNWILDPYNEPTYSSMANYYEDQASWFDTVARLIPAVRAVCDNLILVQWTEDEWYWHGDGSIDVWAPNFIAYLEANSTTQNIVISTHHYHDAFTNNRDPDLPNTKDQLLLEYEHSGTIWAATEMNYPLLIGETGCDDRLTGDDWEQEKIWWNNTLSLYNDWGIGYIGWKWAIKGTFALLSGETWIAPPSESGQILVDAIKRIGS